MQTSTAALALDSDPRVESKPAAHDAEVCPLCLGRYPAALESICVSCEAPSCPECASTIPGTCEVLCYACHVPTTH